MPNSCGRPEFPGDACINGGQRELPRGCVARVLPGITDATRETRGLVAWACGPRADLFVGEGLQSWGSVCGRARRCVGSLAQQGLLRNGTCARPQGKVLTQPSCLLAYASFSRYKRLRSAVATLCRAGISQRPKYDWHAPAHCRPWRRQPSRATTSCRAATAHGPCSP